MEFIKETIQRKKNKLYEWRDRYEEDEYPYKIIQNLFYDLYSTKDSWDKFLTMFDLKESDYSKSFQDAEERIVLERRMIQLNIHEKLETLISNNVPVADSVSYSNFENSVSLAKKGDQQEMKNIEYAYIFYGLVNEFIIRWAAFRLMGKNDYDACYAATTALPGNSSFESFESAFETFTKIAGILFSNDELFNMSNLD